MRRAVFLASAGADLREIALFIGRESGSLRIAAEFDRRLRGRCHALAALPGTLGRPRPDLAAGLRSIAWRGYVIVFRYVEGRFQVVRLLRGERDLPALFGPTRDGQDRI